MDFRSDAQTNISPIIFLHKESKYPFTILKLQLYTPKLKLNHHFNFISSSWSNHFRVSLELLFLLWHHKIVSLVEPHCNISPKTKCDHPNALAQRCPFLKVSARKPTIPPIYNHLSPKFQTIYYTHWIIFSHLEFTKTWVSFPFT